MNEIVFQNIFDKLQEYLPNNWKKVILYAGYTVGSYSIKYYVDCGEGQYIDCFDLYGITERQQLVRLFMEIDKILLPIRNELKEGKKWTVMTMIVDSEGNMRSEFDYENINETSIEYEKGWKERYLM